MAQEKARPTRARTKPEKVESAESATAATPAAARPKRAAAATTPRPRTRKKAAETAEPSTDAIAFHAYLLWESGVPGGPDDHWRQAEQHLAAA